MVIGAEESCSVASFCSVRTAPDSLDKADTPRDYWCGVGRHNGLRQIRTAIVTHETALSRKRFRQVVVVDQPGLPDPDRKHGKAAWRLEGGRIDDLGVVDPRERLGLERLAKDLAKGVRAMLAARKRARRQAKRGAERGGGLALGGSQVSVPRAQGKAVRLA